MPSKEVALWIHIPVCHTTSRPRFGALPGSRENRLTRVIPYPKSYRTTVLHFTQKSPGIIVNLLWVV